MATPASRCCAYCGLRWPKSIRIDDDDNFALPSHPVQTPTSSTRGLFIPHRGRRGRSSSSSRSNTPASVRDERFSILQERTKEALDETRASKSVSPFDNTLGLQLRIKPLHSEGSLLSGRLFKASKSTPLGSSLPALVSSLSLILIDVIDLPLITWDRALALTKETLLNDFLTETLSLDDFDTDLIQFGSHWEKAPRSDTGNFISIVSDRCPFNGKTLFHQGNTFQWSIEKGRVVLWVDIRVIIDADEHDMTEKISSRSQSSRKKQKVLSSRKDIKKEVIFEPLPIDLNAFPPSQVVNSDHESYYSDHINDEIHITEGSVHHSVEQETDDEVHDDVEQHEQLEGEEVEAINNHQAPPVSRKRRRADIIVDDDDHSHLHTRAGRVIRASAKARESR